MKSWPELLALAVSVGLVAVTIVFAEDPVREPNCPSVPCPGERCSAEECGAIEDDECARLVGPGAVSLRWCKP